MLSQTDEIDGKTIRSLTSVRRCYPGRRSIQPYRMNVWPLNSPSNTSVLSRSLDSKNDNAVHVQQCQHVINWEEAKVEEVVPEYWLRTTCETILICKQPYNIYLHRCLHFPSVWNLIMNTYTPPLLLSLHFSPVSLTLVMMSSA